MKWIEYKIVCNEDENILITKRLEYTTANISVARKEAYNGAYTISSDDVSYDKEPVAIEAGGTGAKDATSARENLGVAPKNHSHMASDIDGLDEYIEEQSGMMTGSYVGTGSGFVEVEQFLWFDSTASGDYWKYSNRMKKDAYLSVINRPSISAGAKLVTGERLIVGDVYGITLDLKCDGEGEDFRFWVLGNGNGTPTGSNDFCGGGIKFTDGTPVAGKEGWYRHSFNFNASGGVKGQMLSDYFGIQIHGGWKANGVNPAIVSDSDFYIDNVRLENYSKGKRIYFENFDTAAHGFVEIYGATLKYVNDSENVRIIEFPFEPRMVEIVNSKDNSKVTIFNGYSQEAYSIYSLEPPEKVYRKPYIEEGTEDILIPYTFTKDSESISSGISCVEFEGKILKFTDNIRIYYQISTKPDYSNSDNYTLLYAEKNNQKIYVGDYLDFSTVALPNLNKQGVKYHYIAYK